MTEISPSLLLDDAAQPADGVTTATPRPWYGGDLSILASGAFEGATVQLVMTINMPPAGKVPDDPSEWMTDNDWIELGDPITEPGLLSLGHVNPCMLAVKISASAPDSRIKVLLG